MLKRTLLQSLALAALAPLAALAADKEVVIGVTAGPHAQIAEVAKRVAEKNGLKVKLVEFSDFIQPNAALAQGQLDANIYQHVPFLEAQNKDRGYKLVPVAPAVRQQMGVYSKKVKKLADLPEGARFGIPNDPTNGSRALLVLAEQKLIKLKDGAATRASVLDITDNPKKLKFIELEAAQLPRALGDLDAAAVNSSYAVAAGLSPTGDSLALENPNTPYVTVVIATRAGHEKDAGLQAFVKAYQSSEVKQFVDAQFKGAYTVAW
ncbi:MetQ/NlpA family ABC transporter substrate-binding protein [Paenacidovorax monticola]|uniref:MetQ/NlpA family ABC transporter substrate-binding protein n=1 Tax=Paenacidovorax monticola TaxID=1926868 RepID=A0A7H0HIU7_9BURK|nr:MetQ/NlpA family ABC transporter substrate-binding protein [Paenacidovorax monticola]QNP60463.1 MetQ/NlpA family ABC transporter substrate-binding protein [Paenacidovorax monticola]